MKLQLYSQTIREGESHQAIFNGSEAARGIIDVHIGTLFKLPQHFGGTITMLSMTSDGMYLYVILPLSSRVGDYLSLVLFVPRQLLITAASDIPIIHETMKTVLRENSDLEPLRHFFEWDYTPFDLAIDGKSASGNYARLMLEDEYQSISAFLSKPILYAEIMRYMGVFLITPSSQSIIKGDNIPTLHTSMLSVPKLSLYAGNDKERSQTAPTKKLSTPSKKSPKAEEQKKLSKQWLWGIIVGTIIGLAIGIVASKWLLPQDPKPAMTNPVPADTITTDTLSNKDTIPEDTPDDITPTTPVEPMTYIEDPDEDLMSQFDEPSIGTTNHDEVTFPDDSDPLPNNTDNPHHKNP